MTTNTHISLSLLLNGLKCRNGMYFRTLLVWLTYPYNWQGVYASRWIEKWTRSTCIGWPHWWAYWLGPWQWLALAVWLSQEQLPFNLSEEGEFEDAYPLHVTRLVNRAPFQHKEHVSWYRDSYYNDNSCTVRRCLSIKTSMGKGLDHNSSTCNIWYSIVFLVNLIPTWYTYWYDTLEYVK